MTIETIAIDRLRAHPLNSNVMPARVLDALVAHIERTGRYPPVLVRPMPVEEGEDGAEVYQILDGHHRVAALRRLGKKSVNCLVWAVDDDEAATLLATLNRLRGGDDPAKRAALITHLAERLGMERLSARLPEGAQEIRKLIRLHKAAPAIRKPRTLDQMPVAVHFFLLPGQKRRLERRLKAMGGSREEALMRLVEGL